MDICEKYEVWIFVTGAALKRLLAEMLIGIIKGISFNIDSADKLMQIKVN